MAVSDQGSEFCSSLADLDDLLPLDDSLTVEKIDLVMEEVIDRRIKVAEKITEKHWELEQFRQQESPRLEIAENSLAKEIQRITEIMPLIEKLEASVEEARLVLEGLEGKKRRIEACLTVTKNIQLVHEGIELIKRSMKEQKYGKIASTLLGLSELVEHLTEAQSGEGLFGRILGSFNDLLDLLWGTIFELFKFHSSRKGGFRPKPHEAVLLGQAALVIDVMGEPYRSRLIDWFIEGQLRDYKELFRENPELSSLAKLNNRFHWLQRLLMRFRAEHSFIFLEAWNLPRLICQHFCAITAKDIGDMLVGQGGKLNPDVLLTAIREAQGFEKGLAQIYPEANPASFMISRAFEGHLGLFIDLQAGEFDRFMSELPTILDSSHFHSGHLVGSAPLLFLLVKDSLNDMVTFESASLATDLFTLLNRYLSQYSRYLKDQLPKRLAAGKLLKPADVKLVCILLNTARFSIETAGKLGQEGGVGGGLALDMAIQSFHVLDSLCMAQLDTHTDMLLLQDGCWSVMKGMLKESWNTKLIVGDQSAYIVGIQGGLESVLQQAKRYLSRPETLQSLTLKLFRMVLERFRSIIHEAKPLSESGAQQLLVDLAGLRAALERVLQKSTSKRTATNPVQLPEEIQKEFVSCEGAIKTVLLSIDPPSTYIEGYLLLVGDPTLHGLRSALSLRPLTKPDQARILEAFSRFIPETPSGPIPKQLLGQSSQVTRRPSTISHGELILARFKGLELEGHVRRLLKSSTMTTASSRDVKDKDTHTLS